MFILVIVLPGYVNRRPLLCRFVIIIVQVMVVYVVVCLTLKRENTTGGKYGLQNIKLYVF